MKKFVLVGLLFAGVALAGSIVTLDGRKAPYNGLSNVQGTDITADEMIRIAGMTQAVATYRLTHGVTTLPAGSTIRMVWPDGSAEKGSVITPMSGVGTVPMPGTQCSTLVQCGWLNDTI